jgi:hypothetical protein
MQTSSLAFMVESTEDSRFFAGRNIGAASAAGRAHLTNGSLVYLDHAKHRMEQRRITPAEIEEALANGEPRPSEELKGMVRVEGRTSVARRLRITRLERFPVIVSVVELEDSE